MAVLSAYRYLISPWLGNHCRFHPPCSQYALEAIEIYGVMKGVFLSCRRLLRCQPLHPGGYDPVLPDDAP